MSSQEGEQVFGTKIIPTTRRFAKAEAGAITVDWVALCAMVIALCMLIFAAISDATDLATESAATAMSEKPVTR